MRTIVRGLQAGIRMSREGAGGLRGRVKNDQGRVLGPKGGVEWREGENKQRKGWGEWWR